MATDGLPMVQPIRLPVRIGRDEMEKFREGDWQPLVGEIQELEQRGLATTDRALLTYSMFVDWDADQHETKYRDFARVLPELQSAHDRYFLFDNGTVAFRRTPPTWIVERLGVGGALATVARLVGVTDADFVPVPMQRIKTTDFSLPLRALGPSYEVEVEAKGTHDGASTAAHRRSIRDLQRRPSADPLGGEIEIHSAA